MLTYEIELACPSCAQMFTTDVGESARFDRLVLTLRTIANGCKGAAEYARAELKAMGLEVDHVSKA